VHILYGVLNTDSGGKIPVQCTYLSIEVIPRVGDGRFYCTPELHTQYHHAGVVCSTKNGVESLPTSNREGL
jgi:hypothetical protein